MAMRQPRDMDQVRQDLLKMPAARPSPTTRAPTTASRSAKGLKVGIRFVEVALRCMKNVLIETSMIFERTPPRKCIAVSVTDLESNVTYPLDVRVSKTVERSKPMDDGSYISVRNNSYNKPVYRPGQRRRPAQQARRADLPASHPGSRIIPGDLQDEAEEIIKSVRLNDAANDPDATRKDRRCLRRNRRQSRLRLPPISVTPLDQCSPPELVELRGIYGAIKDGEATWKTVMENKADQGGNANSKPAHYPQDEFEAALKKWEPLIAGGKENR